MFLAWASLSSRLDRVDERLGVGGRSEDASLHLDHVVGRQMIGGVGGSRAVRQQETLVPALERQRLEGG